MTLNEDVECREVEQLAYHSLCSVHHQPLEKCSNERLRRIMDMKEPAKKRTDPMSMSETEAGIARIIQRHRDFFVAMAGLDAGRTDYSLRNDLLRIVELADKADNACLASPPGHKNERGSGFSSPIVAAVTAQAPIPSIASMPMIPAAPPPMYKGWINFCKLGPVEARAKLTQIGVKVGEKVDSDTFTDCEVGAEAMAKLDGFWGEFLWHLEPIQPPAVVQDSFLRFLEDYCPGDDAHDGKGQNRPLLERCVMCQEIYRAHLKAMEEVQ